MEDMQQHENDSSDRIHLSESWEINHWCEVFNLRAEELREIVRKVGPRIEDVRQYLAGRSLLREANF
jgi:hypothetical protein